MGRPRPLLPLHSPSSLHPRSSSAMAFGFSTRALALGLALCSLSAADAWLAPIVAKGNKLFDSGTGAEFRMKGMAYYPRPNGGEFAGVTGYDWTADEHESVWAPHLEVMKDLGVNTIRLYSVDPTKPHDKFMCAASEAGIYVIVGMAAPCDGCAVPEYAPPKCYPQELYTRVQMIYNAFAVYDNTLAFSVGNENNMPTATDKTGLVTAPCVKALLRDTKAYAKSCAGSLRHIPIGLDQADLLPRDRWISYYDCLVEEDPNTSADWLGFNPYVECDPVKHTTYAQSTGLQELMGEYKKANYSRPIMFGEFGCNKGANTVQGFENQRAFKDAKWMNEEKQMTDEIVGGNVFEFSTEIANLAGAKKLTKTADAGKYGVGYFQPDTCDHNTIPCEFVPYPEYENLKEAFTTTKSSALTLSDYTPARNQILSCPAKLSTQLPSTPDVMPLACAATQPVCGGKKSNSGKKTVVKDSRVTADGKTLVDTSASTASSSGGSSASSSSNATPIKDDKTTTSKPGVPSSTTPAPSASSASPPTLYAASAVLAVASLAAVL